MVRQFNIAFALYAVQTSCLSSESMIEAMRSLTALSTDDFIDAFIQREWMDEESARLLRRLVEARLAHEPFEIQICKSSGLQKWISHLMDLSIPEVSDTLALLMRKSLPREEKPDETELHAPSQEQKSQAPKRIKSIDTRFRLIRLHAKGGLGQVYVAVDEDFGREVALKEIQEQYAFHSECRDRFLLEAEVTSKLEHPGIIPVYGMGQYPDGRPYYAMRFVRGDSLKEAIERFHEAKNSMYQSLEFRQLLGRFIDVCQAIGYAHSRGVLHRDLKPGNIMLGEHGETLVVDWGLARSPSVRKEIELRSKADSEGTSSSSTPTEFGAVIGTPAFMPPEQAMGNLDQLGPASDVYSLGATLYQILTGKTPFYDKKHTDILDAVIRGDLTPPRSIINSIPKSLAAVCLKAMSISPSLRYQKPQELAEEIERFLADESIQAYSEPVLTRVSRWIRKHPTHVATATVTIVLFVFSSLVFAYVKGKYAHEMELINADLVVAKNEATREKQQAEGVKDFLVQSFRKLDPEQDGSEVKVLDVLERAKNELDEDSEIDPVQRSDIMEAISLCYWELGSNEKAIPLFEKCLKIRTEYLGAHHAETLISKGSLGLAHLSAGDLTISLDLLKETEQLMLQHLGPDHKDTLTAMSNLAMGLETSGDQQEAIAKYEQVFEMKKRYLGEDNPSTLTAMGALAFAYESVGDFEKGVPLLEKAYELTKRRLGSTHGETLISLNNLALSYLEQGRTGQAVELFEQAMELVKKKYGENHFETISSLSNLADAYCRNNQSNLGIPISERVLQTRIAEFGEEHPDTLTSMGMLATQYFSEGELDRAAPLFEKTLSLRKKRLGVNHPSTITSMNNMGRLYQEQGKMAEALKVFEELLPLATESLGQNHSLTLGCMNNLAVIHRENGQLDQSIELLESALSLMRESMGHNNLATYTCEHNLAMTYHLAKQSERAMELNEHALIGITSLLGETHPTTKKMTLSCAKVLLEASEIEKGVAILAGSIAAQKAGTQINDVELADLLYQAANLLNSAKQFGKAEVYARESMALREANSLASLDSLLCRTLLGSALLRQMKLEESEAIFLKVYTNLPETDPTEAQRRQEVLLSCLRGLVDLYTQSGDLESQSLWQQRLDAALSPTRD